MCFAVNLDDYLNVESGRRDLSQMKSTTEQTGFLFITFSETGRLVVQLYVAGRRQRFRSVCRPMVMQHTRKHLDCEVHAQGGDGNQRTAHKTFHFSMSCQRTEYYEIIPSVTSRSAIVKGPPQKKGGTRWLSLVPLPRSLLLFCQAPQGRPTVRVKGSTRPLAVLP